MNECEMFYKNDDIYRNALMNRKIRLERMKVEEEKRQEVKAKLEGLQELESELSEYMSDLKMISETTDSVDRDFKKRRLSFVNGIITEALDEIFPQEGLQARLDCDFNRKTEAVLELKDKHGNLLDPDMCSGKLQQYLISFSAVAGIVEGLGIHNIYVDEAFGVASADILGDIGQIIKKHIDKGMQIVLVAQNPALYQDLPRKEIHLRKDPVLDSVAVEKELIYG